MAEDKQPPAVVEGATGGDVEEEVQSTAKSAEDRKAQAALSSLDSNNREDESSAKVDQDAVKNAFNSLSTAGSKQAEVKKVKVDAADVALLVEELELTKAKATELLKAHDGDAVKAINAYVAAPAA
ncbi:hypothetical protein SMACR_04835 [Sordaria macrospora]|uniref:WGS project CABT00000000 data, contig 2.1 n=2 Tax=Sordaria macrospora TaxID=5147 RepID=F7VLR6_SORMK|nr:uncharacterized protein SMAC_04835 [Sordaria macrospora k-hell]KAA8633379.1 hypothetical protein SMACR_04835 [Sordaria macrospora]KAH7627359.1 hypothetical protein B0T09DRAFT_385853 [Sordaria sp. MPI-SDFR-AT-0083]WPJ59411.1 hypothetical protein SMAC4_04835 [Sordaria macrospora]CCC06444.1 unnamed protein product [Sordaria macrospora k-hell]